MFSTVRKIADKKLGWTSKHSLKYTTALEGRDIINVTHIKYALFTKEMSFMHSKVADISLNLWNSYKICIVYGNMIQK